MVICLFTYAILAVNPPLYHAMKRAAYDRHHALKTVEIFDRRPMSETWHQPMLDWWYPL